MNNRGIYVTLLLALLSLVHSALSQSKGLPYDELVSDLIAGQVLDFAREIGQGLIQENPDSNYQVFSPTSITSVLALLMLGARGRSYQQLQRVFQQNNHSELLQQPQKFYIEFGNLLEDLQGNDEDSQQFSRQRNITNWRYTTVEPDPDSPPTPPKVVEKSNGTIKVANGVFPRVGLSVNPDYLYTVQSIFSGELKPLDFAAQPAAARDFINSWASKQTNGIIPDMLTDISPDSRLIIANTIYFKGFWEHVFTLNVTSKFYPKGRQLPPVRTEMMINTDVYPFHKSRDYGCSIIGLPYSDNATTMYVIIPDDSTPAKLRELQGNLSSPIIEELISKMKTKEVMVGLPRMKLSSTLYLKSALSHLGVEDIFSSEGSDLSLFESEATCDVGPLQLSRDARNRLCLNNLERDRVEASNRKSGLFVDEIVHKVKVDVNEKGTEAAAVTGAIIEKSGEPFFVVNTPFMFLIRHDLTKLALFYGLVNQP